MAHEFNIQHLQHILTHYPHPKTYWIAFSGGLDSQVLLYAMSQLPPAFTQRLAAVHIHHGLQPQADDWAEYCQQICEKWQIPYKIIKVTVKIKSRESLEAKAREARYQAFAQLLKAEEMLLTAQHADDQAETVMLQLLRGAGVAGLAAMPSWTIFAAGWLARPLLTFTRQSLQTYAQQQQLQWVEDASNQDRRFDRNFLRHEVIPQIQTRWPQLITTLNRVAAHQAETLELIEQIAQQDVEQVITTAILTIISPISITKLQKLSLARQKNCLRYWIKQAKYPLPDTAQLQHILEELIPAKWDRQPCVRWPGVEVRRFEDKLYVMSSLPSLSQNWQAIWQPSDIFNLPLGKLQASRSLQGGLKPFPQWQIRLRQGGERCRLRGQHRAVKKLLQEQGIPPWLRHYVPLIYAGETLAAIPHVVICDGFAAQPGESGWQVTWLLPH